MPDPSIYAGIDLIGGGTGAVDKINGSVLIDKNMFTTIKDGVFYPHWLDDDSGAAENSPLVISPDLSAGAKRWLLAGGVFANMTVYGKLGIGTVNPDVRFGQKLDVAVRATYGGMSLSCWSTSITETNLLDFKKSGSATIGTHVAVANNEALGLIIFRGSNGVEFLDAAYIKCSVDGAVAGGGADDMPGRIEIWTTPDASAIAILRFSVMGSGGVLMHSLKSGASQGAAGAAALELWRDTADNSIKIGV